MRKDLADMIGQIDRMTDTYDLHVLNEKIASQFK